MKTFYYSDERTDDFAGTNITQKPIPPDYDYFPKSKLRKTWAWFFYHIVATPIVSLLQWICYQEKIVGRKKLKPYLKKGLYLYGNHTRAMGDAYAPTLLAFPKKAYIVSNPDAFSMPFIKRIVEDLGGLPVPTSLKGMKNYVSAMDEHARKGHVLAIYPEAHIWPKYTGIRDFPDTSFAFPARSGKPVFTFTTTYHEMLFARRARAVVYVDGPFFADETLSIKENQKRLRDLCYEAMRTRARASDYEENRYVYVKKDEKPPEK